MRAIGLIIVLLTITMLILTGCRSFHLQMAGTNNLEYKKKHLQLMIDWDESNHFLACRLKNNGNRTILLYKEDIGERYAVGLFANGKTVPRIPVPKRNSIFAMNEIWREGIGPAFEDCTLLNANKIYSLGRIHYSWVRFGHYKKDPLGEGGRFEIRTAEPAVDPDHVTFYEDLLDFDWSQIQENEIDIGLSQAMICLKSRKTGIHEDWNHLRIESNRVQIRLEEIKELQSRLIETSPWRDPPH